MKNTVRKILSVTLAVSVVLACFTATAFAAETSVGVSYSAHVQDIGWQAAVSDGATAGTSGQSKRIEALKVNLTNAPQGAHINYQVHVQDHGWMAVASDGTVAGTTGENKRIEAVAMTVSGVTGYTVEYRVHVQDIGWMNWVSGGSVAGTVGQSKRIEAIQIRLASASISSFSITPQLVLTIGKENGTIAATGVPANEVKNISWSSDNTDAATVSNGVVTAVAVGRATITASIGGKTAACLVIVISDEDTVTPAGRAAAEAVINMIDNLDNYSLAFGDDVGAARAAYNQLTAGQKALVTNYADLLRAEASLKPDQYEVDNTYDAATSIPTDGTHQTHTIFPAADVDFIKFNAVAGQTYTIETSNLFRSTDTVIYLYRPDGTTVLNTNDDGGYGLASRIDFAAPSSGTYYVKVVDFEFYIDPLDATRVGQYDVSVTAGAIINEPD